MAKKISELPAAGSALGTDQIPANQGGTTYRLTVAQIMAYGNLTYSGLTTGHILRATGATSAAFQAPSAIEADLNLANIGGTLDVASGGTGATTAAGARTNLGIDTAGGDLTGSYPNPTIAADAVTFAKMQDIATARLIGRTTVGSGDPEEISAGAGLSLSGGSLSAIRSVVSVAADQVLTAADTGKFYLVDTTAARSFTLPAPSTAFFITIKDASGLANTDNISLIRNAAESIEGLAATRVLMASWGEWTIVSDGTNWFLT